MKNLENNLKSTQKLGELPGIDKFQRVCSGLWWTGSFIIYFSATKEHATIRNAQSRKEFNRRRAENISDESMEFVPEIKKSMVTSLEQ